MNIFFCDICNESVPQSDLDRGMAFRRGERVVCASCDKAMSNEDEGGDEAPASEPVEGDSGTPEGPTDAPSDGSPAVLEPTATKPGRSGQRAGLSGCLIGLLFVFLLGSLAVNAILWVKGDQARASLIASVDSLERGDDAFNARFFDLQTNIARQSQEKDASVRETIQSMGGVMDEKMVNLGSRLGRNENAVEALRQSSAEDRRTLETGVRGAADAAGIASKAAESTQEDVGYLTDRVVALEEVLEGGVTTDGGSNGGRQASWASHLPELKDASAGNRWNAVTVLGDTDDPRVVPHLLPMLSDDDVFVRMATARVLGDLGSAAAIPGLIDALSDAQAAVREAAVVALRLLSGRDYRFDPLGKEGDRNKAQSSWRKWWADNSEDLLGD
jgi:hypothetical protein